MTEKWWAIPSLPNNYVIETVEGLKVADVYGRILSDYKGYHPSKYKDAKEVSPEVVRVVTNTWGGARPGAGRPPSTDEPRKPRYNLRATEAEYEEIKRRAEQAGMSVNDYLIAKALN